MIPETTKGEHLLNIEQAGARDGGGVEIARHAEVVH